LVVRAAALAAVVGVSAVVSVRAEPRAIELEPVVYRETAPRPRIVLSKIKRINGPVRPGPVLGAPPRPREDSGIFTIPKIEAAPTLEEAIVDVINRDRRARRLRELRMSRALATAADAHARALGLAGSFTHDWPLTPRSPFERWITRYYRGQRRKPWSAGENLLWAHPNLHADEALAIWLGSPSHRKILVAPYWREIGVGVIRAENAAGVFGGRTVYIAAAEFGAQW
jgi:uncharacterized protein YkwD